MVDQKQFLKYLTQRSVNGYIYIYIHIYIYTLYTLYTLYIYIYIYIYTLIHLCVFIYSVNKLDYFLVNNPKLGFTCYPKPIIGFKMCKGDPLYPIQDIKRTTFQPSLSFTLNLWYKKLNLISRTLRTIQNTLGNGLIFRCC